jgi:hypothetical protein
MCASLAIIKNSERFPRFVRLGVISGNMGPVIFNRHPAASGFDLWRAVLKREEEKIMTVYNARSAGQYSVEFVAVDNCLAQVRLVQVRPVYVYPVKVRLV